LPYGPLAREAWAPAPDGRRVSVAAVQTYTRGTESAAEDKNDDDHDRAAAHAAQVMARLTPFLAFADRRTGYPGGSQFRRGSRQARCDYA
jgi:hypothetical protein